MSYFPAISFPRAHCFVGKMHRSFSLGICSGWSIHSIRASTYLSQAQVIKLWHPPSSIHKSFLLSGPLLTTEVSDHQAVTPARP